MTDRIEYVAELNTEDSVGGLYATCTLPQETAAEALADALALQDCQTIGQAVETGLTVGPPGDERVHEDALLRSFRVTRFIGGEEDGDYDGPSGTYKAALALVGS